MTENLQERIGERNELGAVTIRPKYDVCGQIVDQPGAIVELGNGKFCYVPMSYVDRGEVQALRALVAGPQTVEFVGGDAFNEQIIIDAEPAKKGK